MSGTGRARRQRTVTASLAMIVLATELLVVVLAALALFGLRSLSPAIAFGGGGAVLAVIVVAVLLQQAPSTAANRAGLVLGWAVQAALIAAGAANPAVGVVGLIFAAVWVYSMIVGRRIDRRATTTRTTTGGAP